MHLDLHDIRASRDYSRTASRMRDTFSVMQCLDQKQAATCLRGHRDTFP